MKVDAKSAGVALGGVIAAVLTYLAGHTGCWKDLVPPGSETFVAGAFAFVLSHMDPIFQKA